MTTTPFEPNHSEDPFHQHDSVNQGSLDDPALDTGYGTVPAEEQRDVDPLLQSGPATEHTGAAGGYDSYDGSTLNQDAVSEGSSLNEPVGSSGDETASQDVFSHEDTGSDHVEGKSLGEHEKGETFKEWLAADVQQTKEDLHIGKKH